MTDGGGQVTPIGGRTTDIQVVAVQHPTGRGHTHVRIVGYLSGDLKRRLVEVHVAVGDAATMIRDAEREKAFPLIEVDSRSWMWCLNTGDFNAVTIEGGEGA